MLGLEQAMMMQNVDVSSVHKVIYNYPFLPPSRPKKTPETTRE
jgi:hypothetical protein